MDLECFSFSGGVVAASAAEVRVRESVARLQNKGDEMNV